jgi:hypothetical protein
MTEPSACTHCGIPRRRHFQRWRDGVGWHKWIAPTQDQIKERMLARRAAKESAR